MKTNTIKPMARNKFNSLSRLMPASSPASTDVVASAVISTIRPTCTGGEIGKPNSELSPALIWLTP